MDETSQGSVELLDGVDMVTAAHVEKLAGGVGMREEDLHSPYIELHRGSPGGQLLTTDLIQGHIHSHMVEEFSAHGEQEYYEHHILPEHELAGAERHLAELQAVVEEPQNLSTPVTISGDKPGITMVPAYIHTSASDLTTTHHIIIDSNERGAKLYPQQRLPSLSSLPPLKKALTNSSYRSRYLRTSQPHHSLEDDVTITAMNAAHSTDGTNVIVVDGHGQMLHADDQRLLEAEAAGQSQSLLVEDPITQKLLQESQRIHENSRLLVVQDTTAIPHSLATTTSNHNHRLLSTMNGHHRALDVTDQNPRFLTQQEASVVTSLASQRLLASQAHQSQAHIQSQAELDVTERLLDEESPEHQMLVQEQFIHVVLDQETQEQLGVVPTPGQRVLIQGPGGQWTEIDPASCEADAVDHDSRDTTLGDMAEQGLGIKHEEVELPEGASEDNDGIVEGMDGVGEAGMEESDKDIHDDMNDSEYDVEGDMRSSRHSLPHKKRLSQKLRNPKKPQSIPRNIHTKCYKCNKCSEQFGTQAAYTAHRATHNPSSKKPPAFSCEICGKVIPNQLKFFEHLKAHYEPRPGEAQLVLSNKGLPTVPVENGVPQKTAITQRSYNRERNLEIQTHHKEETRRVQPISAERLQQNLQQQERQQLDHHSHIHHQQPQQHHLQHSGPTSTTHAQPQRQIQRTVIDTHEQQQQQQRQQHYQQLQDQRHHHQRHHQQIIEQHQDNGDMQSITLKVEDACVIPVIKPEEQLNIQHHMQQLQQVHNQRQRAAKHDQDVRQTHHSTNHNPHQGQVIENEPPPLVPILPPVSTITGPVSLTCNLCGKHFRRQKTYETHLSVAHPKQEDIEQFSDPEDMMEGIRDVVEAGEESGDEAESLAALTALNPHSTDALSKAHPEAWYRDEELSAAEADLEALQRAESEQQQLQQQQQQQQQEQEGHHIIQHAQSQPQPQPHEVEVAHMCELCGDAFHSKARLTQHVREEHLDLRQKANKKGADDGGDTTKGKKALRRLACPQCDRVFNHRNSLVYHLRSHSGERPHQCDKCGKSFFATSALKVHMRLHSGDKPYKCEFCGRNFRQWGDLKYHITSRHSEEKQYQCEYCGKDFARKYSLIVHRRIHTGEKNYICEFCNKQFRASSYLQNHRRIHTGEKPHQCEICNKPFRVRSDMKRHLNTHNRDRQRLASSATSAAIGTAGNVRVNRIEISDPDVEGQDSSEHMQPMHNLSLHEIDRNTTLTVVKTDSVETILPDHGPSSTPTPQQTTTISLSSHTTDDGLQYSSERQQLDGRSHGTAHGATPLYVWPMYITQ